MDPAAVMMAALLFNPNQGDSSSSSSSTSSGWSSEDEEMEDLFMQEEEAILLYAMEDGPGENWNPDPGRPRTLDAAKRRFDDDTFLHFFRFTKPQIEYLLYHIQIPATFQPKG